MRKIRKSKISYKEWLAVKEAQHKNARKVSPSLDRNSTMRKRELYNIWRMEDRYESEANR